MNDTGRDAELDFVDVPSTTGDSWRIARRLRPATANGAGKPGLFWLGGFASDMMGAKASHLDEWARAQGRAFLRFDYSGHGQSGGRFDEATLGDWLAQAAWLFEHGTQGPQIVIGTSMGGWIALLLARRLAALGKSERLGERPGERLGERLAGLILLAPAVDFTEALMLPAMDARARRDMEEKGVWLRTSQYAPEPTPITRKMMEEARNHLLLGGEIRAHTRVHIIQGMQDPDVPWRHALSIVEHLNADPTTLTFIADGDHRLSREQDLAQLVAAVEMMSAPPTGARQPDLFA